jgi:hypothetical protein
VMSFLLLFPGRLSNGLIPSGSRPCSCSLLRPLEQLGHQVGYECLCDMMWSCFEWDYVHVVIM